MAVRSSLLLTLFIFLAVSTPAIAQTKAAARPRIAEAEPERSPITTPEKIAKEVFDNLNKTRQMEGYAKLKWSPEAANVANLHCANMARYNFFSHKGLDGLFVNERADELGVSWRAIGENIAYNQGYDDPVDFVIERWMNSPSHRKNILNPRWSESGVGVTVTDEGRYYFTQVFIAR
jgi:uncharacterized protein YkwD